MAATNGDFDSQTADVARAIREAAARGRGLCFESGGGKRFCGEPPRPDCDILQLPTAGGVVAYEPSELFICARAATPLLEIEKTLAANGQMLAFEPPAFGAGATLGGTIACGFSGPRRVAAGAARDFTLGARVIDGRGRALSFGGRVIKNVAGFDVSRLLVGSFGTLGVIIEATLRVSPAPEAEATLHFEKPDPDDALDFCAARSPQGCRSARTLGAAGGWLCGWRGRKPPSPARAKNWAARRRRTAARFGARFGSTRILFSHPPSGAICGASFCRRFVRRRISRPG